MDRIRSGDHTDRDEALETLIRIYRSPLTRWLVRSGRGVEAAEELVQDFTADVIIGRRLFDKADPSRGRLRSLLLTALKRFIIDVHRRRPPEERTPTLPSSDAGLDATAVSEDELAMFDRDWASSVLDEALRRTEAHCRRGGRGAQWALFDRWVLRPCLASTTPPSLTTLAIEVGVTVNPASAIQTVRESVQRAFRELLAEQGLTSPQEALWVDSLLR